MAKEVMTHRERWRAVLQRTEPDRPALDYWATYEATSKFARELGFRGQESRPAAHSRENLSPWGGWTTGGGWKSSGPWDDLDLFVFEQLHIDPVLVIRPKYIGPYRQDETDIFGCHWKYIEYGTGSYSECDFHPLAQYNTIEEIDQNYTWPSADWFDYSSIKEQVKGKDQYPVAAGGSEPFLIYHNLRGMQQAYIDLLTNPELVCYCLDKIFDLFYDNSSRIYEQIPGRADISYVAEDFGSQESLLIRGSLIRSILIPRMKRIIDLVHEAGAYVFFHSDGAVREILPDMVTAGIDILNPIQWRCKGMDRQELKSTFGQKIIFHGGVDNQHTIPFGKPEEVREEVRYNLEVLGAGGGYILAPCHNLQAVTPTENVAIMYRTAQEILST